ncbi:NADP-dependent oxidoreductase [Bacillus wiedmannii]|uniref:NADP-dependent oxidoreductase n=1 Tax=Bacillus wiedmannii TaxID=1890302 RepID=UPI001D0EAD41|nr:NADP-dependent oxidoreductase [Bacillus wiedmannii]MCC2327038.1 NADP-dependent oxidoreductase [Bacillus wiedmannii]
MKAAAISTSGPPNVLKVMEFDTPHAGVGQVRIRVKAAGIQPFDLSVRSGWAPPGFSVQYPQSMPWEEAGAITASGQTAHTALQELRVDKGDTILIHAAAGGVGTFAVQLAQAWGATVIGTASERNHDYLRSLGAIPVTYGDGLIDRVRALAPDGVDVVLDAAGDDALRASLGLVENKERIGTIVAFDLGEELGVRPIRSQRSVDRLAQLVELYSKGKLHIHIRKSFPLHQAADAHREIESGHGRGKVVLTIG